MGPFVRLGVAVARGLLLGRLAGGTIEEVTAAHDLFVRLGRDY